MNEESSMAPADRSYLGRWRWQPPIGWCSLRRLRAEGRVLRRCPFRAVQAIADVYPA